MSPAVMDAQKDAQVKLPPKASAASGEKKTGGDNRLKILEATMKRHQYAADSLIEVLHKAQELYSFLDDETLLYVAKSLKLPPSHVYGVATFYHFFSLKPQGEHTCVVCMGTACYIRGATKVVDALEQIAEVKCGCTSRDNKVSLMTARCVGACGIGPVVVYDGAIAGHQTADVASERVKGWLGDVSE